MSRSNAHRRRLARLSADEDGLSLIEVLVAVFVLSVAIVALAGAVGPSLFALEVAEGRQDAMASATRVLDTIRSLDYADVALDDGDFTVSSTALDPGADFAGGAYDPDPASAQLGDEPLVLAAGGGVVGAAPYWTTTPEGVTVETYVTAWCEIAPCASAAAAEGRRVTVFTRWTVRGGEERSFRTSTLIAEAGRG